MRLRCGGIITVSLAFTAESDGEFFLKIDQHLAVRYFMKQGVYISHCWVTIRINVYALSLPVKHRPLTTFLHPVLS